MARIVYIFKGGYPWDGRLEKICNSFARAGHKVFVVARWRPDEKKFEKFYNFDVFRVGYRTHNSFSIPFPNNPVWISGLRAVFSDFIPELVIVRDFFLVSTARKALKSKRIPIIMDMAEHYPAAIRHWKKYNSNMLFRFVSHNIKLPDKWEKKNVALSDGIITVCEEQKFRLVNEYGFPKNKIEIIYNTPDLKMFEQVKKTPKEKFRKFGHHGFHTSEKSIAEFLEIFVKSANKSFEFIIAGDGDCIPELKQIVERYEAKNVIFTGKYNFVDLPKILQKIDIGVIPYPPNEFNNFTLHNKVFDFLACGIPILVSDAIPLKKLVEEYKCGVSIPIEEKHLINFFEEIDDYDWNYMGQNAFLLAREKYNWAVDEKNLLEFIQKFLQ